MAGEERRGPRRRALAACGLLAVGCAEPTVDALVVWLEGKETRFQVYDSGDRRVLPYETVVEDSDPSKMQIEVMPGGNGFVALPPNDTMVWIDPRDGAYAFVDYDARWGKLDSRIDVLESGLAVTRWNDSPKTGMVVLPTVSGSGGPIWFPTPAAFLREDGTTIDFDFHAARAAPILYAWTVQDTAPNVVIAYELRVGGHGRDALVELDRRELTWKRPIESSSESFVGKCSDGACVSPSGASLIMMRPPAFCDHALPPCLPDDPSCVVCPPRPDCRVLRYRWADALPVTALGLPADCDDWDNDGNPQTPGVPRNGPPEMMAALSDSVVLLEDQVRIYRADLDAGTWQSVPKLGSEPMELHVAQRGGAALLVADNLQVIRADEVGIRIMSAEQMTCETVDATVVSPSGEWVLAVCERMTADTLERDQKKAPRTVVRISPFGLEHFDGIAMRGLAIDDGGNALLYSFASGDSDQEPRGLFVLDANGHLARVDALEPTPLELNAGAPYYFSAQATVD